MSGKTSLTGRYMIGTRALSSRPSNTIGYVVIPLDRDRDEFIEYCKRTYTVAVFTENAEFIRNVKVGRNTMDWIRFPKKSTDLDNLELGDAVLLGSIPLHNKPIVIDIYPKLNEYGSGKEDDFKIGKSKDDVEVSISGDALSGSLTLDVDAGDKQGSIDINVINNSANCNINLFCQGDINLSTRKEGEQSLVNINSEQIHLESDGVIKHNSGNESMVLGDTLKDDIIDVCLDLLAQTTVATMLGTQPLSTLADFQQLKLKTKNILSQKSKLE